MFLQELGNIYWLKETFSQTGIIALSSCSIDSNELILQSLFKLYITGSQHFSNTVPLFKEFTFCVRPTTTTPS